MKARVVGWGCRRGLGVGTRGGGAEIVLVIAICGCRWTEEEIRNKDKHTEYLTVFEMLLDGTIM